MLSAGTLIAESTPTELGGRDLAETVISFRRPDRAGDLPRGPWSEPRSHGDLVTVRTDHPTRALFALTSWAMGNGADLRALTVARPSLEDVYLRLTEETPAAGTGSVRDAS